MLLFSTRSERLLMEQSRQMKVTPHVAQNGRGRRSAVDGRTVRREGYCLSQRARQRVEEFFGWLKTVAGLRKLKWRGREDGMDGEASPDPSGLAAGAYNLVRMRNPL